MPVEKRNSATETTFSLTVETPCPSGRHHPSYTRRAFFCDGSKKSVKHSLDHAQDCRPGIEFWRRALLRDELEDDA